LLFDLDVASYYPNIILQQQLAPESMGKPFLDVYKSIVDRRIKAKKRVAEIDKEIKALKLELSKLTV
jgi:DNA polymerase elongation subunit (family B)